MEATTLPKVTLESKTLEFWNTSCVLHGKPSQLPPKLTTEKAIKLCSDNMAVLNPVRPLSLRFYHMQDAIIMGSPRVRKADQVQATVLKFAR